jgi:hypothetical protein
MSTHFDISQIAYDAFISYSSRDSEWVQECLLTTLESHNLRVCIDYRDFTIGASSLENMEIAVQSSRKTLLVLTPSWINSEWTNFEALLAQVKDPAGRGRRLLPLMVIKTPLPLRLEMLSYLDLTEQADWDFQIRRLIRAIQFTDGDQPEPDLASGKPVTKFLPESFQEFNYLKGLNTLGQQLKTTNVDTRLTFGTLEARLRANLRDDDLFGSSESLRHDRNRIIYELNRLTLKQLNTTFNEMCHA